MMPAARLAAEEFDGELENLRCLVRIDREKSDFYLAVLKQLRGENQSFENLALEGKVLINLGQEGRARDILKRASSRPCLLPAKAWFGQSLLLTGDFKGAIRALDGASAEDPQYSWSYFFRSAARLASGDFSGASRDCESVLRLNGGASSYALRAIVRAAQKKWDQSRADLLCAQSLSPEQTWPLVLCSEIFQRSGDLSGAGRALQEALQRKPSAWLHSELARVYERLGMLIAAIEHAACAVRIEPSPRYRYLKAHLHFCWREYKDAIRECTRALAVDSGNAALHILRSKTYFTLGRMKEALKDVEVAVKAQPCDDNLMAWKAQLLILNGRKSRAANYMKGMTSKSKVDFCRAYADLYEGKYDGAKRGLVGCLKHGNDAAMMMKAGFYLTVATVLCEDDVDAAQPQLYLIGLGVDPPYTATAQSLHALKKCDVIFNNVTGSEIFEFLHIFSRDCRPLAYHQQEDENPISDEIMAEVRKGKTVGFVTRGNAIIYGRLGAELLRRCHKNKFSWKCLPAVSSSELVMAKFGNQRRPAAGSLVLDSSALYSRTQVDPAVPLTLYLNMCMSSARYRNLCGNLAARYGTDRLCLVFDHKIGQTPLRCKMKDLPGMWKKLSPSAIFYIPGKGA